MSPKATKAVSITAAEALLFGTDDVTRDIPQAVKAITALAAKGDVIACCHMAFWHRRGFAGVIRDTGKAMEYLKTAVASNNIIALSTAFCVLFPWELETLKAQLRMLNLYTEQLPSMSLLTESGNNHPIVNLSLGLRLLHGHVSERDPVRGMEFFLRAAKQGLADAQYYLARLFETKAQAELVASDVVPSIPADVSVPPSTSSDSSQRTLTWEQLSDAVHWATQAAQQGHADAQLVLASFLLEFGKDDAAAVQWLTRAAECGNELAQHALGDCYEKGRGTVKNLKKAARWYLRAAEHGLAPSQYAYAMCCWKGVGVPQDDHVAAKWFERAANQNHAESQNSLGGCYSVGRGVKQDFQLAMSWYERAASQGHADAQYNLGVCHNRVKLRSAEAAHWYARAAEQGHTFAQVHLALCYVGGWGVREDKVIAAELFTKAAVKGHPPGQYLLGGCYKVGNGVPQDHAQAAEWFKRAADQSLADAQYALGVCYEKGRGVPKQLEQAVFWFRKSAKQNFGKALLRLGNCYQNGIGVPVDYPLSVHWYKKAASAGMMEAEFRLGLCHENGWGVPQSLSQAFFWYQKAAERGHHTAAYTCAVMYEHGRGVYPNLTRAYEYYTMAAAGGLTEAQYCLGICFESGKGTDADNKRALEQFEKAANHGHAAAQFKLGWVYHKGIGVPLNYQLAVEWYMKAAEQGYAQAQNNLGVCFREGLGVNEKNEVEAVYWYMKAADQQNCYAYDNLGCCYEHGIGVEKNVHTAVDYYRKAAEKNLASAQYHLGLCYETATGVAPDINLAITWYRKAASQSMVDAEYRLALIFEQGNGVPVNKPMALQWYTKAAEQGFAAAQNNLAMLYQSMNDSPDNQRLAAHWYRKAAEQGLAEAQYNLGNCCANGTGVVENQQTAFKWYEVAAKMGSVSAQYRLACSYADGIGVEQNFELAFQWYEKAALHGHMSAQNNLGVCYERGLGVARNLELAIQWYAKSAESGSAWGQTNLGWCYERGMGVEKDLHKAVEWYIKAAMQNDSRGQYMLACRYEQGEMVPADPHAAAFWFRKAAEQGNALAQLRLGLILEASGGGDASQVEAFQWFKRAAEQGVADAQVRMALCYAHARGVEQNASLARYWFKRSAEPQPTAVTPVTSNADELSSAASLPLSDSALLTTDVPLNTAPSGSEDLTSLLSVVRGAAQDAAAATVKYSQQMNGNAIEGSEKLDERTFTSSRAPIVVEDAALDVRIRNSPILSVVQPAAPSQPVTAEDEAHRIRGNHIEMDLLPSAAEIQEMNEVHNDMPGDFSIDISESVRSAVSDNTDLADNKYLLPDLASLTATLSHFRKRYGNDEDGQSAFTRRVSRWVTKLGEEVEKLEREHMDMKNNPARLNEFLKHPQVASATQSNLQQMSVALSNALHSVAQVEAQSLGSTLTDPEMTAVLRSRILDLSNMFGPLDEEEEPEPPEDVWLDEPPEHQDGVLSTDSYYSGNSDEETEEETSETGSTHGSAFSETMEESQHEFNTIPNEDIVNGIMNGMNPILHREDLPHSRHPDDLIDAVAITKILLGALFLSSYPESANSLDITSVNKDAMLSSGSVLASHAQQPRARSSGNKRSRGPTPAPVVLTADLTPSEEPTTSSPTISARKASMKLSADVEQFSNFVWSSAGMSSDSQSETHPEVENAVRWMADVNRAEMLRLIPEQFRGDIDPDVQLTADEAYALFDEAQPAEEDENMDPAICLYAKAAVSGHMESIHCLALCLVDSHPEHALQILHVAAERDHSDAASSLGLWYMNGTGGVTNLDQALFWLGKAASSGNLEAQYFLWKCHAARGDDPTEAINWLCWASARGYPPAQLDLCCAFVHMVRNHPKQQAALEQLLNIAHDGHLEAEVAVAAYFMLKPQDPVDLRTSARWLMGAVAQSHCLAECLLGVCGENGFGVVRNPKAAVYYYARSVAKGFDLAEFLLARAFLTGFGVSMNAKQAYSFFLKAASQGTLVDAMFYLGECFENGLAGVPSMPRFAFQWYQRAATELATEFPRVKDSDPAVDRSTMAPITKLLYGVTQQRAELIDWVIQAPVPIAARVYYAYGRCFLYGLGTDEDQPKGIHYIRKSAEQGYDLAQKLIASCFAEGVGVPANPDTALHWYTKCNLLNDVSVQYQLAVSFDLVATNGPASHAENALKQAVKFYQLAAAQDHPDGQYKYALCLAQGRGVRANLKQAAQFMRKAAEQGIVLAQHQLGLYYEAGTGVSQNAKLAAEWFAKAAEKNHAPSMSKLGACYHTGAGVQQSAQQAVHWYKAAAALDDVDAHYNLGRCYQKGVGGAQDSALAVFHFTKAAEQGHAAAQVNLGQCYEKGDGVEVDMMNAAMWYGKAADQGLAAAQNSLGLCFENGTGVEKDLDMAVKLYTKAAKQGHAVARRNLARITEKDAPSVASTAVGVTPVVITTAEPPTSAAPVEPTRSATPSPRELPSAETPRSASPPSHESPESDTLRAPEPMSPGREVSETAVTSSTPSRDMVFSRAIQRPRRAAQLDSEPASLPVVFSYTPPTLGTESQLDGLSMEELLRLAETGRTDAQFAIARRFELVNDLPSARKYITQAASANDAEAQYILGCAYLDGMLGCQVDANAGRKWLRKAAGHGHSLAQYRIGCIYLHGVSVQPSSSQAIAWFTKAAEQGLIDAQFALGCAVLASAEMQTEDVVAKAIDWLHRAAESGHVQAMYQLGQFYELNVLHGRPADLDQAIVWYRQAAQAGLAEAAYDVARCYSELSMQFVVQAAQKGHSKAMNMLGGMLEEGGLGYAKDPAAAVHWYRRAAEAGLVEAKKNLAACLVLGVGDSQRIDEAVDIMDRL